MNEQSVLALKDLVLNYRFERSHNSLENCEQTNCILSVMHPSNVLAEATARTTGKVIVYPATGSLKINVALYHTRTIDYWASFTQAVNFALAEFHSFLHNPESMAGVLDDERIIHLTSRRIETECDIVGSTVFFDPSIEPLFEHLRYLSITPLRNADDRQRVGASEDDSPLVVCKVEAGNQDFGVHTFAPGLATAIEGYDFDMIVRQNVADTLNVMAFLKSSFIPNPDTNLSADKS